MKALMNHSPSVGVERVPIGAMNDMPPISRLQVRQAELVPGQVNTWYEYIPERYEAGGEPVPLVVQLHGGGQDGRRWASLTMWHLMAERENLIVVYPNSPQYGCWMCDDTDVQYLYDLIERLCDRYRVDRSRIYMQGMSNGDMMTLAFTMKHPEVLAAAGYMTGPSAEEAVEDERPVGALPILQMRGELDVAWKLTPETVDVYATRYGMNDFNRALWLEANGTDTASPVLSIRGKDNFLLYRGRNAPIINWEIQGMGHREPSCSGQVLWDRLYSGCRMENGQRVLTQPRMPIQADKDIVLLAAGSRYAWCGDHRVAVSDVPQASCRIVVPAKEGRFCPVYLGEMAEIEAFYAPVETFSKIFGADITFSYAGEQAAICLKDGRKVILRSHALLIEVDGVVDELQKPCMLLGGVLYVPIGELAQMLFNSHVSMADDMLCIAGHYALLGRYTARQIRGLLGGSMRPRQKPVWDAE